MPETAAPAPFDVFADVIAIELNSYFTIIHDSQSSIGMVKNCCRLVIKSSQSQKLELISVNLALSQTPVNKYAATVQVHHAVCLSMPQTSLVLTAPIQGWMA